MKRKDQWFLHPEHGYMLRRPSERAGYDYVVTALCQHTGEEQRRRETWEQHKRRLHVNAGCGAIVFDEHKAGDRNPAFAPVDTRLVPLHIRKDFRDMFKD